MVDDVEAGYVTVVVEAAAKIDLSEQLTDGWALVGGIVFQMWTAIVANTA